jgi:hypothetical protein
MRRWINAAALALAVASAAACGGEPTAPQAPAEQGPRRTLTPLSIELTAPTRVGTGEGCWYYANPYGGSGTYYISWSGLEGYHYANDTQVLGWIDDLGLQYVEVTVFDGTGASASAGKWVNVGFSHTGC